MNDCHTELVEVFKMNAFENKFRQAQSGITFIE